jgi:hypothetical protein
MRRLRPEEERRVIGRGGKGGWRKLRRRGGKGRSVEDEEKAWLNQPESSPAMRC